MRGLSLTAALLGCLCRIAQAHPADVSHMRADIQPQRIELKFSLNLATLQRICVVDADQDGMLVGEEIQNSVPGVVEFMQKHIALSVNEADQTLPALSRSELIWPHVAETKIDAANCGSYYVDFVFTISAAPVVRDLWLNFDWYAELGELHTTQAIFAQEGQHEAPVEFTVSEPDYLWDTSWTEAPAVNPPASSPSHSATTNYYLWAATLGIAILAITLFLKRRGNQDRPSMP